MAKYTSGKQKNLKIGISSYSENLTSLEVIGNVGIGTTNATSKLHIVGNTLVTGIVTATSGFIGNVTGNITGNINSSGVSTVTSLIATSINASGIITASSLRGYNSLVGTASSTTITFIVAVASKTSNHRYFGNGSGSAYFIDDIESPFLTLLPGKTYRFTQDDGSNGSHQLLFYYQADKTTQYTTNVTTNGSAGSAGAYTEIIVTDTTPVVLHYQCINHPYMGNAAQFNSNVVDTPYQITARSGINVTGTVTATTFVGALTGTASNVTTNANLTGHVTSVGNAAVLGSFSSSNLSTALTDETGSGSAVFATSPTLVTPILGNASATNINVSGVSTLGSVQISSGIISAISGVVTYFGDGSNLQGVNAFNVINQDIISSPVFPTFASNTGVSSVGISTTKLVFIPATGNLGIGTTNPTRLLDVYGAARLRTQIHDATDNPGASLQVLTSGGSGGNWSWQPLTSLGGGTLNGIIIQDEGGIVGTAGSITTLNFKGSNIVASVSPITSGIATITVSDTPTFLSLNVSPGNTTVGFITASNINVSGVSTLGSVQISSGIISATSGIVTYFGDGSALTGIGGIIIKDDGSLVGTAGTIDFGTNLSVSFSSGTATITASGGGGGVTELKTIVSTTSPTGVGSFAVATHRSADVIAQITQGSNFQVGRYLMIHNGSTVTIVEESSIATGSMLGSFDGVVNGSNAELRVTMVSAGIATITTKIDKVTIP